MNADNIPPQDARFLDDIGSLLLKRIRHTRRVNGNATNNAAARNPGQYLRHLRVKTGVSRQALAALTALPEAQIAALENGFIPSGSIGANLLHRLAAAFCVNAPLDLLYPGSNRM